MKRIISLILCLCVISSILSLPAFAETVENVEIYASGLIFFNEMGNTIPYLAGVEKVGAEVSIRTLSGQTEFAFSILSYCKGVLTGIETTTGTAGETGMSFSTPLLAIDAEKAENTTVMALITTTDFGKLLANAGTLGTSENEIEKILINDYEIAVEEGVTEYSLTRYIKKEKFPPDIKVYPKDLASDVFVSSDTDGNITEYTITVYNGANKAEEYKVSLTGYAVEPSSLVGVEFNGKALEGFAPQLKEYTYDILSGAEIPEIEVYKYDDEATVEITSPTAIPGVFAIKVENGESVTEYKINLRAIKEKSFPVKAFAYQYQGKVGTHSLDGSNAAMIAQTTQWPLVSSSASKDYTGYASFDVEFPSSDITLTGTSKLTCNVGSNAVYNLYNSYYDHIKENDGFAEFNDGLATLLCSLNITNSYNQEKVFEFPSKLIKITDNDEVILALASGSVIDYKIKITNPVLTLQYVEGEANNVLSLSDAPFDESVLAEQEKNNEPVEGEITPVVTKEWVNDEEDVLLKITVTADKPVGMGDEKAFVKLIKPEMPAEGELTAMDKYAYMTQAYENEEGNISSEFLFSGAAGEYTVALTLDKSDIYKNVSIYIPETAKMSTLVHGLENETFDGAELEAFLSGSLTELAMDGNLYAKLGTTGRTKAAAYVVENIEDFTVDGINSILSEASSVKGINGNESDATIEACIAEKCINDLVSANPNFADYTGLESKSELFEMMCEKELSTPAEVEESLYGNLAAYKIKNITTYGEVSGIADIYKNYIDADTYNLYSNLTLDQRILANKYITENRSSIKSIEDVSPLIDNAVAYALIPVIQPPAGGGGSGGGGGGGSIGLGSTATEAPKLTEEKSPFSDVPSDHWGYDAITELYVKKVIKGKSADKFCPDDKITRAEFAKLLVEALDLKAKETENKFGDVSSSDWYYNYVLIAYGNGVINGVGTNVFAPNKNITRQDAAVMLKRASGINGEDSNEFKDDADISEYAKEAVYALKKHNILNGYNGLFNPTNNLSRAEAAQLIYKLTEISIK